MSLTKKQLGVNQFELLVYKINCPPATPWGLSRIPRPHMLGLGWGHCRPQPSWRQQIRLLPSPSLLHCPATCWQSGSCNRKGIAVPPPHSLPQTWEEGVSLRQFSKTKVFSWFSFTASPHFSSSIMRQNREAVHPCTILLESWSPFISGGGHWENCLVRDRQYLICYAWIFLTWCMQSLISSFMFACLICYGKVLSGLIWIVLRGLQSWMEWKTMQVYQLPNRSIDS